MLKFLTHKLRTHSLNEESVSEKVEERDSGTESDDEAERAEPGDFCTDVIMKWNDVTDISMGGEACACAPGPRRLAAPEPDQLYDHHSSEEELEVINGAPRGGPGGAAGAGAGPAAACAGAAESRRRGASSPPPAGAEKRKWPAQPYDPDADDLAPRPASSDDDDTKVETPVRFRTSPPLEALKPRRAGVCSCAGAPGPTSPSGPAAQRPGGPAAPRPRAGSSAPLSPRRRRTPLPPPRRHRPALDFDKMQQVGPADELLRTIPETTRSSCWYLRLARAATAAPWPLILGQLFLSPLL